MTIDELILFLKKETKLTEIELNEKIWTNPTYYIGLCGDIIGKEAKVYDYDYHNDTKDYNRLRVDTAEQAIFILEDIHLGKLLPQDKCKLQVVS